MGVFKDIRRTGRRALLILALAATAGLGGCWWHDSLVPAIGEEDRARRSPFRAGVYCSLEAEAEGMALSAECARFGWDRGERQVRVTEIQEDGQDGDEMWLDAARIDRGLVLLQNPVLSVDGGPPRYELFALIARREGYAMIPLPPPAVRDAIAAQEGVSVEESEGPDGYGRIVAGDVAAVRRVVERSALAWVDAAAESPEDRFGAFDSNPDDADRRPAYSLRLEALGGDPDPESIDRAAARLRDALADLAEG